MSYYYEINKQFLQALEAQYGLPTSMVTVSWETVNTSLNGLDVVIESSEPLDENILGVSVMNVAEARILVGSDKYYKEEII